MTAATQPLAGLRVAVTRPEADATVLAALLERDGAIPTIIPLTRIDPPPDDAPLRESVAHIEDYDWIVLTSANAVRALDRVIDWERAPSARIAVVGSGTAEALRAVSGRTPDLEPAEFSGHALATALERELTPASRVFWPRAERAGDSVARSVAAAGARLDAPVAYVTTPDPEAAQRLGHAVNNGDIDVITFTAPSALRALAAAGYGPGDRVVACVGPVTAAAAAELGISVHVVATEHTMAGLVRALADFYHQRS